MPELLEENNYLKEQLLITDYELGRRSLTDRTIRKLSKLIRDTAKDIRFNKDTMGFYPSLKIGKKIWKEIKHGLN